MFNLQKWQMTAGGSGPCPPFAPLALNSMREASSMSAADAEALHPAWVLESGAEETLGTRAPALWQPRHGGQGGAGGQPAPSHTPGMQHVPLVM